MKKTFKKSKGFTLVELLIVVVIIGILAGMMMLSTGGATAKAEATKIVSDMRNIKAGAIMVYADSNAWPTTLASIDTYMDQAIKSVDYELGTSKDIIYKGPKISDDKVVKSLSAVAATGVPITNASGAVYPNTVGTKVYMKFTN